MRIVIIADVIDTGLGGMKTYAENLVRCIPEVDGENEYFIINHNRSDKDRNVQFVAVPYSKYPGKFFIRKLFQVPRKIRSLEPDVVMETTHIGPFFLPKKVKRVTVIHDLSTFIYPEHYTWLNRKVEHWFLPGIIKKADHLITVSESTKMDIQKFFDVHDEKLTVIPLGVEDIFRPTINQSVLDQYAIDKPYLLHVGTIQPRKNIEMLIDAFDLFRDASDETIQLVLVGKKGWKSDAVFDRISKSKYSSDILYIGHVPKEHLPVLYTMTSIFVFPSHYEGFGLPLAEAISCGARCIAADNSSLREVGIENTHFVNISDHYPLANAVKSSFIEESLPSSENWNKLKHRRMTWHEATRQLTRRISNIHYVFGA